MMLRRFAYLVYFLFTLILVEPLLAGYYYLRTGEFYYTRSLEGKGEVPPTYHVAKAVFQPYFGYTLQPGRMETFEETRQWRANNFGFVYLNEDGREYCCDHPFTRRDGELIVGIFGGSVGTGYALHSEISDGLAKNLSKVPGWQDKTFRILNFAQPGFRQPQQLATLAYFLSIGQEFDLIVNIDGFNEVVTSWRNWDSGVEPSYPADTLWGAWGRSLEQYDVAFKERGYLLANYHQNVARELHSDAPGCVLASCRYAKLALATYHDWRAVANRGEALDNLTKRSYFPTKTFSPLPRDLDIYRYTAKIWRRSSTMMSALARGHGALYVHLLQPNQWFEPAGPYQPIDPKHPYEWVIGPVNKGYTEILSETAQMRTQGVEFIDLTKVFSGQPARDVYVDDCCHYTAQGYEQLFAATATAVATIHKNAD